jgi:hypothetical protein
MLIAQIHHEADHCAYVLPPGLELYLKTPASISALLKTTVVVSVAEGVVVELQLVRLAEMSIGNARISAAAEIFDRIFMTIEVLLRQQKRQL